MLIKKQKNEFSSRFILRQMALFEEREYPWQHFKVVTFLGAKVPRP